jgi:hypothetical protein
MVGAEKKNRRDEASATRPAAGETQERQATEQRAAEQVREGVVQLMSAAQRAAERARKREQAQKKAIERAFERAQEHEALDERQEDDENSTNFPPHFNVPDTNKT